MPERFAVFYAPDRAGALWQRASEWLGRDAAAGAVAQAVPEGCDATAFGVATTSARRYGFHATIKPPMRLAAGTDAERLFAHARAFAAQRAPVAIGPVELRFIQGFLALVPVRQSGALAEFAAACVASFEPFRAPLSDSERMKRLQSGLTSRQTELLDQYGYPYVMDEFRFHMTLTDRLAPADAEVYLAAASRHFGAAIADPLLLDRICIYHEPSAGSPLERVLDIALTGGA